MKKKLCKVFLVFSLMLGIFSGTAILFDNDVYAESTTGNRIVEEARKHIGKPYKWAGNGPNSFDCSGLVYYVHKQVGINFTERPTAATLSGMGTHVTKNNLQPGDIITFKTDPTYVSHVGIYIGNGNMIHAPTFDKTVEITNINTSYWQNCYYNARRLHSDNTPLSPAKHGTDTVGLYVPNEATFFFQGGAPYASLNFGNINNPTASGFQAITGDWDGDGIDTVAIYVPSEATFYFQGGAPYASLSFGNANDAATSGFQAIAGDWDGDGIDTVAIYVPSEATFYFQGGAPYASLSFGNANISSLSGFQAIAGDWDGDGIDTVALYVPSEATFYFQGGAPYTSLSLGNANDPAISGFQAIAGDWDGDGIDTVALYVPSEATFYFQGGAPYASLSFGNANIPSTSGFQAIAGNWDGN